jgi:NTP pyrophosphatase (non-canonical NTP hydrolase)
MIEKEAISSKFFEDVAREAVTAEVKYGSFTSAHEGYGVLAEEVAELLAAIRSNKLFSIQEEAIQVAAVALRIAQSLENSATAKRSGCLGWDISDD